MSTQETIRPSVGTCRGCGAPDLRLVLDLGRTPLANSLLTPDQVKQPEPTFPLALALCEKCALAQIPDIVPPEGLFSEYLYFSSFSDTMLSHAAQHAAELIEKRQLGPQNLVMEIASNDGYLLKNFVKAGVPVVGIEPAKNIAKVAVEKGIRTISEFFGDKLSERLIANGLSADVVLANNVMAHVPDINSVIAGIKRVLKPDGVFVMETPYLKNFLDESEFDTIYHEHVFYYSLTALENLFQRHGLTTIDVKHLPIHGGSIRVTASHAGAPCSSAAKSLFYEEARWGVNQIEPYEAFAANVRQLRVELVQLLRRLKAEGKTIAAYGASAKGSTLLNYFGIGGDILDFVVDRSTYKQGRYTPGTHLPILPPSALTERMPDYTLLLTWNFAQEILSQQADYRAAGGKFIVPIPHPTLH